MAASAIIVLDQEIHRRFGRIKTVGIQISIDVESTCTMECVGSSGMNLNVDRFEVIIRNITCSIT